MLSEKAKLQLQMFLTTLEKETGIKAEYLQVYQHHGTEEYASKLEQKGFEMEAGPETTWAAMEDIINECRLRACYFYTPEEPEEIYTCDRCGKPMTDEEMLAPFLEETCTQCYHEQKQEQRELVQYFHSTRL